MRITWPMVESAAKLAGWTVKRKSGAQTCQLMGLKDFEHHQYDKPRALLHSLTALLWKGHDPKEIREALGWSPHVVKGQGIAIYDWAIDNEDASLAAVCSRIWPNNLLDH